ncbi:MAG: HAD family hydrolase [Cyanobacteria bacterium P01_G01_bin.54]
MTQQLLALDFDGVICDGLAEYFQTTCRAYGELWTDSSDVALEPYRDGFYAARPIIESGWEMPVMLRALVLGQGRTEILASWPPIRDEILRQTQLTQSQFAQTVDGVRDRAITEELRTWLALHCFYPGVVEQLQRWLAQPDVDIWIISTKEGRFIAQLLQQAGVELPRSQILGKESRQPKYVTLGQLRDRFPTAALTFVEDRLPALEQVLPIPELAAVHLYLADWGYNTATLRAQVKTGERIQLLSLEQFSQLAQPL